jgi:hypothetical protein
VYRIGRSTLVAVRDLQATGNSEPVFLGFDRSATQLAQGLSWLLPVLLIPSLFVTAGDRQDMSDLFNLKTGWRACYLSGKPADECDDANGAIHPDPDRTHLQEKLDYLRATRQNLFSDR